MGVKGQEWTFYGNVYSEGCPGCKRIEPQPEGLSIVFEDKFFRAHQDYALPIPGMMVIETKRHVARIEELTDEERGDLVEVWSKISTAVKSLGYKNITHVLEDRSSHFHLWLMPIHQWMKDEADGKLRNLQDIFDYAKKSLITGSQFLEVEKAAQSIRIHLSSK